MIFKDKVNLYINRKSLMDYNIHKALYLVLLQCTDLLQRKLKQQAQWDQILFDQNTIVLLAMIKTMKLRFEKQNFPPFALYQSKADIHVLHQDDITNQYYLQRFNNLVDLKTAYNRWLYDQAITEITTKRKHLGEEYYYINADQNKAVQTASSDLYSTTIFITQSDSCCYGKLSEELKN